MKMITAIVNKEDANAVCNALTKGGFSVTKLSTTGGFLMAGNMTLLIGTASYSQVYHAPAVRILIFSDDFHAIMCQAWPAGPLW